MTLTERLAAQQARTARLSFAREFSRLSAGCAVTSEEIDRALVYRNRGMSAKDALDLILTARTATWAR